MQTKWFTALIRPLHKNKLLARFRNRNRRPLAKRLRLAARVLRMRGVEQISIRRALKRLNWQTFWRSMQLSKSPLSRKLIGLMAGLIIASVGMTGYLAYDVAERNIRSITQQRLRSEADKMAEKITILRMVMQDEREFDRALRKELERQQATLSQDGLTVSELFVTQDAKLVPYKGMQEKTLPVAEPVLQELFVKERGVDKLTVDGESYTVAYAKAAELQKVYMLFVRDAEYLAPIYKLRNVIAGAIVSAALLASLIALVIVHGITKPIEHILAAIREVSTGDYTRKITLRISRRSEMGSLITHFNTMVDDVSDVMTRIKRSIAELNRAGNALAAKAQDTAGNAALLKQRSLAVADSALRIRETTDKADRSFADMKQVTAGVISQFDHVQAQSHELLGSAEQGRLSIEKLLGAIRGYVAEAAEMKTLMQQLMLQAKEVEKVLGMIRTLADETKLVSLNATIEAARAGEAGKSFAVVAKEVQRLADQSNCAADDIRKIVRNIQVQTLSATDVTNNMVDRIINSESLTETAEASFRSLLAGVADSSGSITAMADQIDQLTGEIAVLERGIGTIADIATETDDNSRAMTVAASGQAAAAVEASALAEQIHGIAARLGSLTERLRVAERSDAQPDMTRVA